MTCNIIQAATQEDWLRVKQLTLGTIGINFICHKMGEQNGSD